MLACSPKSAGRGRSERESRVSSAGRAVYRPNAKGLDAYICTYGRLVPLRVPQVETAWSRLVRVVRLAPDRSPGLRGGIRRMGATCTDAQIGIGTRVAAASDPPGRRPGSTHRDLESGGSCQWGWRCWPGRFFEPTQLEPPSRRRSFASGLQTHTHDMIAMRCSIG